MVMLFYDLEFYVINYTIVTNSRKLFLDIQIFDLLHHCVIVFYFACIVSVVCNVSIIEECRLLGCYAVWVF
jgi:hypothetical protein